MSLHKAVPDRAPRTGVCAAIATPAIAQNAALFEAFVKATSHYTLAALQRYDVEFSASGNKRDIDVGLMFEAIALRMAADAVDRRRKKLTSE